MLNKNIKNLNLNEPVNVTDLKYSTKNILRNTNPYKFK